MSYRSERGSPTHETFREERFQDAAVASGAEFRDEYCDGALVDGRLRMRVPRARWTAAPPGPTGALDGHRADPGPPVECSLTTAAPAAGARRTVRPLARLPWPAHVVRPVCRSLARRCPMLVG